LKVIKKFSESGGTIIALNALPKNSSTDFPSSEVLNLSGMLFGNDNSPKNSFFIQEFSDESIQIILNNKIKPDFTIAPSDLPILCSHKKMDGNEALFVTNDSNENQEFTLSFPTMKKIEQWDPNTGEIREVSSPAKIKLEAFNGILFKISKY
jgi:hypothetical protein